MKVFLDSSVFASPRFWSWVHDIVNGPIGTVSASETRAVLRRTTRKATGASLRVLRKRRNITQEKLAQLLGIDRSHIRRLEHGLCGATMETVSRIVIALGVSMSEFGRLFDAFRTT